MKIEKMNEFQIRCTLTQDDLVARHIKMSEMKYGKPKTIKLFQDIIREASLKYNFNEDGQCIMVDATPLNTGSLVLILTKVQNPDELDTRFSRFAPSIIDEETDYEEEEYGEDDYEEESHPSNGFTGNPIIDFLEKLRKDSNLYGAEVSISVTSGPVAEKNSNDKDDEYRKVFVFSSMRDILIPASSIGASFHGISSLYKDLSDDTYLLMISVDRSELDSYRKACNILSEYGKPLNNSKLNDSYLKEHFDPIIIGDALERIGCI